MSTYEGYRLKGYHLKDALGDPYVGRVVLDSFEVISVAGEGSFARAYLAHQLGTERKAIVKIAHDHLLDGDRANAIRQYFANELRASTRVKHPNLVTIYTAGETDEGAPAIAMEYVDGVSLEQLLIQQAPLPARLSCALFHQLLQAIHELHNAGIVHCDISPTNVMVQSGGSLLRAVLLDFGIARLEPEWDTPPRDLVQGTPGYTAAEQLEGNSVPASDIFSLGALMWWAFSGEECFAGVET
ncbi:MAG: serine/threonine-protein kinase, partial [Myxococcota bacterium]